MAIRAELQELLPRERETSWSVEGESFPLLVQLLHLPPYREKILLGLVVSVGGITERLVRAARDSLFSLLAKMSEEQLEEFSASLLAVFKSHQKVDRVTVPLLR